MNGKKEVHYKLDIDKMLGFVFDDSREVSTEITENYVESSSEEQGSSKVIREVKNEVGSSTSAIKYDLIKFFLGTMVDAEANDDGSGLSFGETLIINTLLDEGIIIEMN